MLLYSLSLLSPICLFKRRDVGQIVFDSIMF